ncbi:protein toc75 chloroplastic [Phtheirospermum japonicum]|uniref:Protein toc75 chloroplastic n=1 Tax=Phtheirospermum japonicum TaxID=374723 RepID=A0A830DLW5_9LAMI|nr:protein toc75 chloroplastic [Phtheirospermum japonicum]
MNKSYQKRIGCARECLLPQQVRERIEGALRQQTSLRSSLLRRIVFHVEKWYHDNGFYGARVVRHGPLESNDQLIFEVNEGDITKLDFKFQDKLGNICKGNTNIGVIKRALPREIAVGKAYNIRALDKAYESIYSLNLFSNVNIIPQFDHRNGAMSAEIVLQERPQKWRTDVRTCLKMVPGLAFLPTLTSLQQSGTTIYFERQNIKGLNRSFQGAITLSNLFYPEDFNFEYTHPYMDGLDDPRNRTLRASCFNTRQHSPVFRCGPRANDKPICVDRKGFKATITENYTEKSKFTYGVVMEDIRTRDEDGSIAARGHRVSFNGPQVRNNSPDSTTLSGTGIDRMATFQANLTRDNTISVNGTIVGARDVIQVDQGVGIDTKPAFFNRLQMSATRFIPLRNVQEGEGNAAPPLLVLHGAIGNCVGDVPYHEAFTIGGPNSARGYNVGETAASRRKLEVAAEIRVPVKNTNTNLCGFVEHRNDLGGSIGSPENRTRGHGSSAGVGIQLGLLRAEYVLDDSSGKGSVLFHLGERF